MQEQLTERQNEVYDHIVALKTRQTIADELGLTLRTVDWFIKEIRVKLGYKSTIELITNHFFETDIPGDDLIFEGLNETDRQVVDLLIKGYSIIEIAEITGQNIRNTRERKQRIHRRLGLRGTMEIVKKYYNLSEG